MEVAQRSLNLKLLSELRLVVGAHESYMGCSSSSFEGENIRPGMQKVLRAADFCKDFCRPFWRKPCPCMKLEAMHRASKEGFRSADFHKLCFWLNVKFTWFKSVSEQISNTLDWGPAGSCYVWAQRCKWYLLNGLTLHPKGRCPGSE